MPEVDRDLGPRAQTERARTEVTAERVQLVGREHPAATRLAPCDAFELAHLLERVDAHVRVRSDAEGNRSAADALCGKEAVAEVCLGGRARADDGPRRGEEVELDAFCVGRMYDRGALGQAAGARKQFDRAAAVLGEAVLDLLGLLVGVDVERQLVFACVPSDLLEPVGRARPDGVGGDPDAQPGIPEPLDLLDELGDRLLAEAGETSAGVGDMEEDKLDAHGCGGLGSRQCFDEAEVMELANRRVPGGEHHLPPRPEVTAGRASP